MTLYQQLHNSATHAIGRDAGCPVCNPINWKAGEFLPGLSTLAIAQGYDAALRIVNARRFDAACGVSEIWQKLDRVRTYLNGEAKAALAGTFTDEPDQPISSRVNLEVTSVRVLTAAEIVDRHKAEMAGEVFASDLTPAEAERLVDSLARGVIASLEVRL